MLIYSRLQPDLLLHGFFTKLDWETTNEERTDLSQHTEFLQIATIKIAKSKKFPAHRHIYHDNHNSKTLAQESWVVIAGEVEVSYFDLDNSLICKKVLYAGELSYTFYGGHSYEGLSEHSQVYEFKSGPYLGRDKDKELI